MNNSFKNSNKRDYFNSKLSKNKSKENKKYK